MNLSDMTTSVIQTDADIQMAMPLIQTLFPHLSEDFIRKTITSSSSTQFFLVQYEGKAVAYYSFSVKTTLVSGKGLYIEDVVVSDDFRRMGVAQKLIDDIEAFAKTLECDRMDLICGVTREASHKFWEDVGFTYSAKYFMKEL